MYYQKFYFSMMTNYVVCVCVTTDKSQQQYQLVINIDHVSLPMSCVLLPGQSAPDPNACCYIRYRVYDKGELVKRVSHFHFLFPLSSSHYLMLASQTLEHNIMYRETNVCTLKICANLKY